jgi:hypothetical protein
LEIKIVGDKLGGAEPIKPWPELLAVLASNLPLPHPSTARIYLPHQRQAAIIFLP